MWYPGIADSHQFCDLLEITEIVEIEPLEGSQAVGDGIHAFHVKNHFQCFLTYFPYLANSPYSKAVGDDDGLSSLLPLPP